MPDSEMGRANKMSIPIRFTHHISEKCAERGFDRDMITTTIRMPDRREVEETVSRYYKTLDQGDTLVVIAATKPDFILAITAWIENHGDT